MVLCYGSLQLSSESEASFPKNVTLLSDVFVCLQDLVSINVSSGYSIENNMY